MQQLLGRTLPTHTGPLVFLMCLFYSSSCKHQQRSILLPAEVIAALTSPTPQKQCACPGVCPCQQPLPAPHLVNTEVGGCLVKQQREGRKRATCDGVGSSGSWQRWWQWSPALPALSETKLVCSATRLSRAVGCNLGGEYPEQSRTVTTLFCLMSEAL